jgi:hypothetical protein
MIFKRSQSVPFISRNPWGLSDDEPASAETRQQGLT